MDVFLGLGLFEFDAFSRYKGLGILKFEWFSGFEVWVWLNLMNIGES